jgi:hypothetical protein
MMRCVRSHEPPNGRCLRSARLMSRISADRIASADGGFSVVNPT